MTRVRFNPRTLLAKRYVCYCLWESKSSRWRRRRYFTTTNTAGCDRTPPASTLTGQNSSGDCVEISGTRTLTRVTSPTTCALTSCAPSVIDTLNGRSATPLTRMVTVDPRTAGLVTEFAEPSSLVMVAWPTPLPSAVYTAGAATATGITMLFEAIPAASTWTITTFFPAMLGGALTTTSPVADWNGVTGSSSNQTRAGEASHPEPRTVNRAPGANAVVPRLAVWNTASRKRKSTRLKSSY